MEEPWTWAVSTGTPGVFETGAYALRCCLGSLAHWLAQPAQTQLLKIRVVNLSPWLVVQKPVALATSLQRPAFRLPRLAAGPWTGPSASPLSCPPGEAGAGVGLGVEQPRGPWGNPAENNGLSVRPVWG